MPLTTYLGGPDTTVAGSNVTITLGRPNFGKDWRLENEVNNMNNDKIKQKYVDIRNLRSPIDAPESVRFSMKLVDDIYKKSSIEATARLQTASGFNVMAQLNETVKFTSSEDPFKVQMAPITARLVLEGPNSPLITPTHLKWIIERLVSLFFETGDGGTDRINALVQGILLPVDVNN